MLNSKKVITVGLLWHSISSDNLGVGALTESQIAICQSAAEKAGVSLRYIVFGTHGNKSYVPDGIDLQIGGSMSLKEAIKGRSLFLKDLNKCDLVLDIGEGDSFSDIYGLKRYLFLLGTKIAVLAKKIPLILSPQTIGPFEGRFAKHSSTLVMKKAKKVFARDSLSMAVLKEEGVTENAMEVIDVAFKLPYKKQLFAQDGKVRVGINVSGLMYNGGYTRDNQFGLTVDYAQLIDRLIAVLIVQEHVELHLVPHVLSDTSSVENDYEALILIAKKFPGLVVAPKFKSPSEAKSYISGLDFFTGARMHACIAAFSSGVPVVPMAYSRKFNGLFNALGFSNIADMKKQNTEDALKAILDGFEKKDLLKVEVEKGNILALEKVAKYESYLVNVLQNL